MARDAAVVVCVAGWLGQRGVEAGGVGDDGDGEAVHSCRSLDAQPAHSGACTVYAWHWSSERSGYRAALGRILLAKRCLVRLQHCRGHTGLSEESRPETSSGFSRLHNGRWNARSTWRPANHMPSQHTLPLAALSCERTVGTLQNTGLAGVLHSRGYFIYLSH